MPGAGWNPVLIRHPGCLRGEGDIPRPARRSQVPPRQLREPQGNAKRSSTLKCRCNAFTSRRASQDHTQRASGERDLTARSKSRREPQGWRMCGWPWGESRPSFPSTTWKARNGTRTRSHLSAQLAGDLIRRLRKRFAPGALLHFGQGKWCPGEQAPRWAFGCFWRKDGVPVWENVDLVANEQTYHGVSADDSALFLRPWQGDWASIRTISCRPTRMPGITSGRRRRLPANVSNR